MQKNFKLFTPVILALMALSVLLTVITLFFDTRLFIICGVISAAGFAVVYVLLSRANRKSGEALYEVARSILYADGHAYVDSHLPTIAVYSTGEIIWYNEICQTEVFHSRSMLGQHIHEAFPDINYLLPTGPEGTDIEYEDSRYTAHITVGKNENAGTTVIYLMDDTEVKNDAEEYYRTKPSMAIVLVDNYEEMIQDHKDIERAQIMGQIEEVIKEYFSSHHGFVTRLERDRYLVNIQEQGIEEIKEDKFEILNKVRSMQLGDRGVYATLSIGIGHGTDDLIKSEEFARQAIDMCLGRGGDQAAIKTEEGYEFFGGVSSGVEKRTKIKTRIIASALSELIEASSNVIIMGHRFADLDALGAGVGMLKAVREMGKSAFICIDKEKNLVTQLIERLESEGYSDSDFRSPERALRSINSRTLLIVVDVHVANVLESQDVYEACRNVVVIDHHRKLVDYIDNAVIFYHEPYASSASEMVTELIQYFPVDPKISKVEAEALLAGITLDTKNFVMRTGVRTFEAAAWLRRMGADTVAVKQMFSSSMDSYLNKAVIVSKAETYKNCAITYSEKQFEGIRVVASQAADDLMNISGTNASFVIFPYDGVINVSARSMGAMNVQVIMESLGGGGHLTMAAAQFEQDSIDNIREKVKAAIDEYYDSLSEERRKELAVPIKEKVTDSELIDDAAIIEGQNLSDNLLFTDDDETIV